MIKLKKSLETVIPPCEKSCINSEELLLQCAACYPIVIAKKFGTGEKGKKGLLGISNSLNRTELHFCLFQESKGKYEAIARFVLHESQVLQLKGITELIRPPSKKVGV